MFVRISLLRLTIHVGFVSAAVMILTIVVLAAIEVAILTTDIVKHGSIRAITVIHLVHVRCTVLRILLIVGTRISITRISMTLVLLHVSRVLSMMTRYSWCWGVVTTALSILLNHSLLRA